MKGLKIKYQNFHFENLLEVIKKKTICYRWEQYKFFFKKSIQK